jgi:hypothetical protein
MAIPIHADDNVSSSDEDVNEAEKWNVKKISDSRRQKSKAIF